MEAIITSGHVSFILVFLEGIISFFSPCVIPLIPVYMGYLAGNANQMGNDGIITYERKKVFIHTLFFVLGISFAFFILGMSFTALGSFFYQNKMLFTRIGGILIILLGLFQIGFFEISFLQRERKIPIKLGDKKVNPLMALVMGFTFSFAWTPCVGPALSSVLIMASGAKTALTGNMLVFVYALGFVLPFLILGLFTTQVLEFIKNNRKFIKYTIKAGGIILIIMGIMTFTGWMNGVSSYLNSISSK
ncbi:MAG: cytochrome biosis protein transrane region family, partial [Anaerocolumna sp.]|nr:cytochrome biosis protein transrane region family [Anaerocolumna sp.]